MEVTPQLLDARFPAGAPWSPSDPLPGGSQGAVLVSGPRGDFVAKAHPGAAGSHFEAVRERVEVARGVGVPAPQVSVSADDLGVVLLLELLPGTAGLPPTPETAVQLVDLNSRLRGLGTGSPDEWQELMERSLTVGLSGYCEHASLQAFSDGSRELLRRIRGLDVDWTSLPADDLVHYDFHPGNVLVQDGAVSGIVDWDGCRAGDGLLDLAGLAFCSSWTATDAVVEQLWSVVLSTGTPERRAVAVHHIVLRLADWCIRYSPADHAARVIANGAVALRALETGAWSNAR